MCYPVFIDGHVHLHDFVSIPDFLSSTRANLRGSANVPEAKSFRAFLCLADFSGSEGWTRLIDKKHLPPDSNWSVDRVDELIVSAETENGDFFWIIPGRQIVTSEGLEIMALAVAYRIPDGSSFRDTLAEIEGKNGLAVVPWGVGKWWGRRGKIITETQNQETGVLYGDNGGRPWFWYPRLLELATRKGLTIVPGSDPLPIKNDCLRNGVYGVCCKGPVDANSPLSWLLWELRNLDRNSGRFGKPLSGAAFFYNQLQLRIQKVG